MVFSLKDSSIVLLSLKESPSALAHLEKLIADEFPAGTTSNQKILASKEFALLLGTSNHSQVYFLQNQNGEILSCAAYRLFDIQIGQHTLRCAGLGLIVTPKAHRGHGYSSFLQQTLEQKAKQQGAIISVLWSDLESFYNKLGYFLGGCESFWSLNAEDIELLNNRLQSETQALPPNYHIQNVPSWSSIKAIYEKTGIGPLRNFSDYDAFLTLPATSIRGIYSNQTLLAYYAVGKARDLSNTIHEFVGDQQFVPHLLLDYILTKPKTLRVQTSPGMHAIHQELEHYLGPAQRGALCFMKILDIAKLIAWLNKTYGLPAGVQLHKEESNFFTLTHKNAAVFRSDDPTHLIQLFLGPWKASELDGLDEALRDALSGYNPPPIYFWGFDSV